jgi:L-lactate dehydrogenase complex protein LldE
MGPVPEPASWLEGASFLKTHAGPRHALEPVLCFGGSFSVCYPGISGAMVQDKAAFIEQANVSAVVSTDAACLMNIAGCLRRRGSTVRALHLAEALAKT